MTHKVYVLTAVPYTNLPGVNVPNLKLEMDFSTPVKQLYHGFMNLANCLFRTQVLEPVNELISPFMKCKLTDFLLLQFLKLPKKREVVCFSWTFCGLWVSSWPAFHTNTIRQDFGT